jgi:hypothetical protein
MHSSQLPTTRQSQVRTRGAAPESRPRGPTVLGRYRLVTRLGAGAFGTVWQARDERLERDVAVKILPRERIVGGRFEREAKAAARLSHPGIVTLYEAAVDDDGAYLVSELVVGATLAELLQAGRLSDRDIVAIGIVLCEALDHAHACGVIHRDVKPSNVLVPERPGSPAQPAKLTDFGVARVVGGDSLTRTGDVVGTIAYMAPEQAEGREAGAAADLYSVALVLYEALTGVNPVLTGTAAVRARRLGAHLPPLRRQRRELPRELGQAIDMALRPRARERGTPAELRQALTLSLDLVDDHPGVVAAAWPASTGTEQQETGKTAWPRAEIGGRARWLRGDAGGRTRWLTAEAGGWSAGTVGGAGESGWPIRALGAVSAAGLAVWAAGHALAPAPLAPPAIALIAALAVALAPRLGWLALVAGAAAIATSHGRAGLGTVLAIAGLAPAVLLPRSGSQWPLPAICPWLGAIALAGAWPAIAGRAGSAWRRAVLAALGWLWLLIAGPATGRDLYVKTGHLPTNWESSPAAAVHHVLAPLLISGALAAGAVWALAAVVLPWIRHRRAAFVLNLLTVLVWAAAGAASTAIVLAAVGGGHGSIMPGEGVLGTIGAALGALAPAIGGRHHPADADSELA